MQIDLPQNLVVNGIIRLAQQEYIIVSQLVARDKRYIHLKKKDNDEVSYLLTTYDNSPHLGLLCVVEKDPIDLIAVRTVPVIAHAMNSKVVEALIIADFLEDVTGMNIE